MYHPLEEFYDRAFGIYIYINKKGETEMTISWRQYLKNKDLKNEDGKKVITLNREGENVIMTCTSYDENTGVSKDPIQQVITPQLKENELKKVGEEKQREIDNHKANLARLDERIENINAIFADAPDEE